MASHQRGTFLAKLRTLDTSKNNPSARTSTGTPPPAYTPHRSFVLPWPEYLHHFRPQATFHTPAGQALDADGLDSETSPVSLSINSSMRITNSNNVVCLISSAADQANSIAQAVMKAVHENTTAQCGIPMIDENGAPRRVKIQVDASMSIGGADNIIANETVIQQVLKERSELRRLRRREEQEEDVDAEAKREEGKKQKRSLEDVLDETCDGPSDIPSKRRRYSF